MDTNQSDNASKSIWPTYLDKGHNNEITSVILRDITS